MNKKIYIIDSFSDDLPGVKKDIENLVNFFKSPYGGEWKSDEIEHIYADNATILLINIDIIKELSLDYVIIIYSGHGCIDENDNVYIWLQSGIKVPISYFFNLSNKQLFIFDCCRKREPSQLIKESSDIIHAAHTRLSHTRKLYEELIECAMPQKNYLFACSPDEFANDTTNGAAYISELLRHSVNFTEGNQYKTVLEVQTQAEETVPVKYPEQHPDHCIPKLLRAYQLPFSINPLFPQ